MACNCFFANIHEACRKISQVDSQRGRRQVFAKPALEEAPNDPYNAVYVVVFTIRDTVTPSFVSQQQTAVGISALTVERHSSLVLHDFFPLPVWADCCGEARTGGDSNHDWLEAGLPE